MRIVNESCMEITPLLNVIKDMSTNDTGFETMCHEMGIDGYIDDTEGYICLGMDFDRLSSWGATTTSSRTSSVAQTLVSKNPPDNYDLS